MPKTRGGSTQRRATRVRPLTQTLPVMEVVQCAALGCERTLERPVKPRGRPRLYCSDSCRVYQYRNRQRGTHTVVRSGRELLAEYQQREAQRRAAPLTFADLLTALRDLPELHKILTTEPTDAIKSAHGHEVLRHDPAEATGANAHPAESQQQRPNRTRPKRRKEQS